MSWNYRVVKSISTNLRGEETFFYTIQEAYYEDGSDKAHSITEGPGAIPMGENLEELAADLRMMLRALDKPVLNDKDF